MAAPPKPLSVDIHTSVKEGDLAKVFEFLEEGGDVNVRCRHRTIPLHRAAAYSHEEIANLLLEKGADIEEHFLHAPIHGRHYHPISARKASLKDGAQARDGAGQTPLFWASKGGHEEMVTLLLSKGAHINAQDKKERTPLHEAARHGQKDTCALLLKRGAKRDIMDVDANEPGEDSEPSVPESIRCQIRNMIEGA